MFCWSISSRMTKFSYAGCVCAREQWACIFWFQYLPTYLFRYYYFFLILKCDFGVLNIEQETYERVNKKKTNLKRPQESCTALRALTRLTERNKLFFSCSRLSSLLCVYCVCSRKFAHKICILLIAIVVHAMLRTLNHMFIYFQASFHNERRFLTKKKKMTNQQQQRCSIYFAKIYIFVWSCTVYRYG